MKQRKVAISLAVAVALAAPFMSHAYRANPTADSWEPLTGEDKDRIINELRETNDCRQTADRKAAISPSDPASLKAVVADVVCRADLEALQTGGQTFQRFSPVKFLAINVAVAVAAFVLIFGLSYSLPALVRCCRRWLNT
jgi:hypothetical protein